MFFYKKPLYFSKKALSCVCQLVRIRFSSETDVIMDRQDHHLTGYGPPARGLYFDGDAQKWEEWEVKFLAYMNLKKLKKVVMPDGGPTTPAKLEEAFSELVQFLDSRSLQLIMRDGKDNGREAMRILRDHYAGRGKQRIVSLYKTLCNLKMLDGMDLTDYILKGETVAAGLKSAGEIISDGLLQSMLLNGLPECYRRFEDIVTQRDKMMTFSDFKVAIRNYEENRKVSMDSMDNKFSSVMKIQHDVGRNRNAEGRTEYRSNNSNHLQTQQHNRLHNSDRFQNANDKIICFSCGGCGHKSFECPNNVKNQQKMDETKWCSFCESSKHNTQTCKNKESEKDKVNSVAVTEEHNEFHSFCFGVSNQKRSDPGNVQSSKVPELLVDSGSTSHIVNDEKKFVSFDRDFSPNDHYLELASGEKLNNVAKAKGMARVEILDENGIIRETFLKEALYIPSFPYHIFSVKAATKRGAQFYFGHNHGSMSASDGTNFPINSKRGLYFLNLQESEEQPEQKLQSTMFARLGTKMSKSYAEALRFSC